MARNYKQGVYHPRNPDKYIGDINKIVYRSSWELEFNRFLDNNPNILEWMSEEIKIPYMKPTDNKIHHYYPDYWIRYRDKHNNVKQSIIEVKPHAQTQTPRRVGKNKKTQLYEQITWAVNKAKWKAATEFCKHHNMDFKLVTEKNLFI